MTVQGNSLKSYHLVPDMALGTIKTEAKQRKVSCHRRYQLYYTARKTTKQTLK